MKSTSSRFHCSIRAHIRWTPAISLSDIGVYNPSRGMSTSTKKLRCTRSPLRDFALWPLLEHEHGVMLPVFPDECGVKNW